MDVLLCFFKMWSRLVLDKKHQDQFKKAWRDIRGHIPRVCHEYIEQSWFISYKISFVLLGWQESNILDRFPHPKLKAHMQYIKDIGNFTNELFLRSSLHEPFLQRTTRQHQTCQIAGQSIYFYYSKTYVCGCSQECICLHDRHHVELAPPRRGNTIMTSWL